jgi:hypothetical protein
MPRFVPGRPDKADEGPKKLRRTLWDPDIATIKLVQIMESRGHPVHEIVDQVGVSRATFYRALDRNPALEYAYHQGIGEFRGLIREQLIERAKTSDKILIHLAKCRLGDVEPQHIQVTKVSDDELLRQVGEIYARKGIIREEDQEETEESQEAEGGEEPTPPEPEKKAEP